MKSSDLKTGMVVEMRDRRKYLVVNNYFIAEVCKALGKNVRIVEEK